MTTDDDWISFSKFGSRYEEQMNRHSGHRRHRLLPLAVRPGLRQLLEAADLERPWIDGPPPRDEN